MVALGPHSTAEDVVFASEASLSGKVAVVTGATSGLGKETARALALAGARVLVTARSLETGEHVAQELQTGVSKGSLVAKRLDLTDVQSIRAFGKDVAASEERLDIVVCNAGVMATPKSYTPAGFEMQIGTNHFGHFELVQQLLPKLESQTFPSRVVMVASIGHRMGAIHLDDLHFRRRRYTGLGAYGQSKLANILFAKELAKRTPEKISAFAIHPGFIATNLGRHVTAPGGWVDRVARSVTSWFFKTIPQGAATSVYAAVWPGLEQHSGAYLADCAVATPAAAASDMSMAAKLWDETAEQLSRV